MSALLTYRSRNSFESRFGRNTPDPSRQQNINGNDPRPPTPVLNEHWAVHNDGHRRARSSNRASRDDLSANAPSSAAGFPAPATLPAVDPQFSRSSLIPSPTPPMTPPGERKRATTYFSAQSYLRYQGEKFVKRFDSNCYIAITRKMDTHDVSRQRVDPLSANPVAEALARIDQPALVIGIESDGLFTFAEQQEIAAGIPNSRLRTIDSPEGHDAFLLQFEQVNRHILEFLHEVLPDIMQKPPLVAAEAALVDGGHPATGPNDTTDVAVGDQPLKRKTLFGEEDPQTPVEDITAW